MSASTTAICVTYNSAGRIGEALAALRVSHEAGLLECIVVDNASADGTAELVEREHPWAQVVRSGENLGYGRGLNLGLKRAQTPYVLFMNPDAVVPKDAIEALVGFMASHERAGLVAPAIREEDGGWQQAGGLPTPGGVIREGLGLGVPGSRAIVAGGEAFATNWLCGAVLLGRRELMVELGGFDPRFFLYFEETDLCRRVLDRGGELWAVGQAVAWHAQGDSARTARKRLVNGCIAEHYFPSRFYYLAKHHGRMAAIGAEVGELATLALAAPYRWLRRRGGMGLLARLRGPVLRMPAVVCDAGPGAVSPTEAGVRQ